MELFVSDFPNILVQVLCIVGLSRALGPVVQRAGQPLVVADIIAGMLLGPACLGFVAPALFQALFAPNDLAGITAISQLGLVLFMFLVGLEIDPAWYRGRTWTAASIGAGTVVAALLAGMPLTWLLYSEHGGTESMVAFSLFIVAAMSATAFPVLARILDERHMLGDRLGSLALAAAAVSDFLTWLLVILAMSVHAGEGLVATLAVVGLKLAVFALVVVVAARPVSRWARRLSRYELDLRGSTRLLLLLFGSCVFAELLGVHTLFAAFLVGAVIPRDAALTNALHERLEVPVTGIFLPVFFAVSGLRTQPMLLEGHRDVWILVLLCVASVAVKVGGGALVGRWKGLSWTDAKTMGVLLNTRGLMTLVVLNVGLDVGVVSARLFTMLVIVALVTTMMTGPWLRAWLPATPGVDGHGGRLVRASAPTEERSITGIPTEAGRVDTTQQASAIAAARIGGVPSDAVGETILVALSDPERGATLAQLACGLVTCSRGPIVALHLRASGQQLGGGERAHRRTADVFAPFQRVLAAHGVSAKALSYVSSSIAGDIVQAADARSPSWIVLGAHDALYFRSPLSGVVAGVVRQARGPVLVLWTPSSMRGFTPTMDVVMPPDDTDCGVLQRLRRDWTACAPAIRLWSEPDWTAAHGARHPDLVVVRLSPSDGRGRAQEDALNERWRDDGPAVLVVYSSSSSSSHG